MMSRTRWHGTTVLLLSHLIWLSGCQEQRLPFHSMRIILEGPPVVVAGSVVSAGLEVKDGHSGRGDGAPSGPGGSTGAVGGGAPVGPPVPGTEVMVTLPGRYSAQAVAGGPLGTAAPDEPKFGAITGIVPSEEGTLYLCDAQLNSIWAKTDDGARLIAGSADGTAGYWGENIPAIGCRLDAPMGLALDGVSGVLFVADSGNDRIRCFAPGGRIYTVAGGGFDPGDVVSRAGDAKLDQPFGVALDAHRNVYFTERGTSRVRKIDASGRLSTLARFESGQVGAIAVDLDGERGWVAVDGKVFRLRLAGGEAPTEIPVLGASVGVVKALAYDQTGTLYAVNDATSTGAATRVWAIREGDGAAMQVEASAVPVAGTAEPSAFWYPRGMSFGALGRSLAQGSFCGLAIDLHHASDPIVASGALYLVNYSLQDVQSQVLKLVHD